MRVALIDDDEEEHLLIARQLSSEAQSSFSAFTSMEEATRALSSNPPDVILLDLKRKRALSPAQSVAEIRAAGIPSPVIFISTSVPLTPPEDDNNTAGFLLKDQISLNNVLRLLEDLQ